MPGGGSRAARCRARPAAATMGVSGPGRQRNHNARHRDRGGRRRRWATAAQWAAGRQGGRGSAGDGVSPSYLLDFNERDILHTTGIHKQVGAPKKVRKKGAHLLCSKKKVRLASAMFLKNIHNPLVSTP